MWLGDITVGDQTPPLLEATQVVPPVDTSNPYVSLAANLVDIIHPYKQGVPVNVAIAPQTQTFLMMGGILIGGLFILSLVKR
jgi:hypothetical protein